MTYEEMVAECKKMRSRHERAEAEFFLFLMKVDAEMSNVWREAGCSNFDQFLRSNHLTKPERYRAFALGVSKVGADAALANGAPWTMSAGSLSVTTPEALKSFAARATAFIEVENVAPSEEAVRQWRAELDTRATPPVGITRASELLRLREENKALRAKLAAAEKRIKELEEITTIKKKGKAA